MPANLQSQSFTLLIVVCLLGGCIILFYMKNKNLLGQLKNYSDSCLSFSQQLEYQRQACEKLTRELKEKNIEYETKIISLVGKHAQEIRAARKDASDTQRSIIKGKINEHIAPLLSGWKWNCADARFNGSPVDYIIFNGLSEDNIQEIIFLDVKTGSSQLTTRQRQIRDCVKYGKVIFETFQIEEKIKTD